MKTCRVFLTAKNDSFWITAMPKWKLNRFFLLFCSRTNYWGINIIFKLKCTPHEIVLSIWSELNHIEFVRIAFSFGRSFVAEWDEIVEN